MLACAPSGARQVTHASIARRFFELSTHAVVSAIEKAEERDHAHKLDQFAIIPVLARTLDQRRIDPAGLHGAS